MCRSKKLLFGSMSLLQLVSLAGFYIFEVSRKSYMGMNRWIVYQNRRIAELEPLLHIGCALVLLLMAAAGIGSLLHRKKQGIKLLNYGNLLWVMNVVLAILVAAYLLFRSPAQNRYYYFHAAIWAVFLIPQFIKAASLFGRYGKSDRKVQ